MVSGERRAAPAVEAYVGLGSNMDDPAGKVRGAMRALGTLPATRVERCSSLYRSAPIGHQTQPDFVNAVCRLTTQLGPNDLMRCLLDTERAYGRVRSGPAGGPRTLDLDLLLYGDWTSSAPELAVPHPRMHERAFVLLPLLEIAPGLVIPGQGRATDLLARCGNQRIERLAS